MIEYKTPIADNARWQQFVHRPGDIFECTPPKCGTTWTQTIVNSLIFPDGDSPGPVMHVSPWLEMSIYPIEEILERLEAQTHRRCIKSHTPADGIPWFDDVKYIVVGRDGRDAFMSMVNHMDKMRPVVDGLPLKQGPHEMFPQWIANAHVFHHIKTFWDRRDAPNVLFVHYNDLKADLEGEMRRIASFLGIELPESKWPSVVERCTFESMKRRGDEIGDFDALFEGGSQSFLFKGSNDRWRDVLTKEELTAYDKRVAEVLPRDAREWLAHGRSVLSA